MNAIGTLAQNQLMIQNVLQLQTQAGTLEQQISTGLKSTSFADIAPDSATVLDLTAQQSQQQSYIDTGNTLTTRLQTMSLAMSNVETVAQQFNQELQEAAFSNGGTSAQTLAKSLLQQIGDYLNTKDGSRYLFAGNQTQTAPFNAAGLPNPGSLSSPVNGAFPAGYYQGDNGIAQATIDTNVALQYGVTANNTAFEQIVRVLNFFANAGPLSSSNATDVANVTQGEEMLTAATTQVQQLVATTGMQQSQLNSTLTAHQNSLALANTSLGKLEQVDSATAITQLNSLQTQLQASYQTINMLQGLSLANYLK